MQSEEEEEREILRVSRSDDDIIEYARDVLSGDIPTGFWL